MPVPTLAIRRTRLEQLVDDHPDRQIVLVRGPAGSGKSVFVSQWAAARSGPCAWLAVDASDNDADHLEQCLDEAVSSAATVVVDGVDAVHAETARQVLGRLVEHPPDGVRLVLVGRAKPRIGLERARLRGDLVEVGPAALRFRRREIEALAAAWTERPGDVADLEQETLGWAAGLRLLQLEAAPEGPGDPDVANEYVREELIDGSSRELQSFLEVTCWLPAVTEEIGAAAVDRRPLTPLELEALPLVPVASRPGALRYPPILARALRDEYRRRDRRAATQALVRAADACRRSGDPATAVDLLLGADQAADTVATAACADLAASGDDGLRRLDELFRRHPDTTPTSGPWVAWRAQAAVATGHVAEAATLLRNDVGTGAPSPRELSDGGALAAARGAVAERMGDVAGLQRAADRLLDAAPADDPRGDLTAHCWRVRAMVWSGQVPAATMALRGLEAVAAGLLDAASPIDAAGDVALARAWVAWSSGDVETVAGALLPQRRPRDDGIRNAERALLAGFVHRERNQLAEAVVHLRDARTIADNIHHVVAALAASELARCHRSAGAFMDALELLVSTRSSMTDLPPAVDVHLRSTEARVRLDQHDIDSARAVVRAAPPGVETQLLAARVALAHSPARAGRLLASVHARTPRQAVEVLLLRAQLPGEEPSQVAAALVRAVSEGGPLGLVRTFLDEGPVISRLLGELTLASGDPVLGRIGALARQELALGPGDGGETIAPVEQLTTRELAVLRMLPLRLSNREMADQMYISVNTLKTHVRAIYRKLDVPHRSAAVRRARALALV